MFAGKKRSFGQRLLNGSGGLTIEGPSGSRFDMRDEVDLLVLTRFGEMNFVAGPGERAFIAKMGLWVIRRIKAQSRWRQIFGFAPAQLTFHPVVLIHPGLPQGLNRRKLAQGRRSRWLVESVEQPGAICSDQLSIGFTRLAPSGQPRIFNAGTIAIKPLWCGVFTEPLWRTASKGIECRTHHLPNTFEPIEGPDSRQDMGRVGSLFASCFQQTLCFKALQHGFQQQHLCRSCEQTSPKFREHREIKSRICQIQRESIFPVNSATNSLCRLPIREPFNKLENTDQCELPRGFGRPASLGEERGK